MTPCVTAAVNCSLVTSYQIGGRSPVGRFSLETTGPSGYEAKARGQQPG